MKIHASFLVDFIKLLLYNIIEEKRCCVIGLAIFYDPCLRCEHRETHKMCNMCELTYHRNQHVTKELNPKLSDSFDWKDTQKELEEYVDKKFECIKTKLEEQDEQGTH